jgi:hypothetical protein
MNIVDELDKLYIDVLNAQTLLDSNPNINTIYKNRFYRLTNIYTDDYFTLLEETVLKKSFNLIKKGFNGLKETYTFFKEREFKEKVNSSRLRMSDKSKSILSNLVLYTDSRVEDIFKTIKSDMNCLDYNANYIANAINGEGATTPLCKLLNKRFMNTIDNKAYYKEFKNNKILNTPLYIDSKEGIFLSMDRPKDKYNIYKYKPKLTTVKIKGSMIDGTQLREVVESIETAMKDMDKYSDKISVGFNIIKKATVATRYTVLTKAFNFILEYIKLHLTMLKEFTKSLELIE